MDYRYAGKRKTLSFGPYPAISLKDVRNRREEAREMVAKDIDPGERKKEVKAEAVAIAKDAALTFKAVANEWFEIKKDAYAASNIKAKKWITRLNGVKSSPSGCPFQRSHRRTYRAVKPSPPWQKGPTEKHRARPR